MLNAKQREERKATEERVAQAIRLATLDKGEEKHTKEREERKAIEDRAAQRTRLAKLG